MPTNFGLCYFRAIKYLATNMSSAEMLTEGQREALALFREISQVEDEQLCIDVMMNYDFNVDAAVNGFMLGGWI